MTIAEPRHTLVKVLVAVASADKTNSVQYRATGSLEEDAI